MSLFDPTIEENKIEETNQGFVPAAAGINDFNLKDVSVDDKGNLFFKFKGCTPKEQGSFSHVVWVNVFDEDEQRYVQFRAYLARMQMVRIAEAYLSPEAVSKLTSTVYQGNQLAQSKAFINSLASEFSKIDYKTPVAKLKIVLNYKDATDKYGNIKTELSSQVRNPIISTDLKPFALRINDAINEKSGEPYERIKPLSEYGTAPDQGAPAEFGAATNNAPFEGGAAFEAEAPAFG